MAIVVGKNSHCIVVVIVIPSHDSWFSNSICDHLTGIDNQSEIVKKKFGEVSLKLKVITAFFAFMKKSNFNLKKGSHG